MTMIGRRRFVYSAAAGLLVPAIGMRPAKAMLPDGNWGPAVSDDRPIGGGGGFGDPITGDGDSYPFAQESGILEAIGEAVTTALAFVEGFTTAYPGVAGTVLFGLPFEQYSLDYFLGNSPAPPDWLGELLREQEIFRSMPPDLRRIYLDEEEVLLDQPITIGGLSATTSHFRTQGNRMQYGGDLGPVQTKISQRLTKTVAHGYASCCFTKDNSTRLIGHDQMTNNGAGNVVRWITPSARQRAALGCQIKRIKTGKRDIFYKYLREQSAAFYGVTLSKSQEYVYPLLNQCHKFYSDNLVAAKKNITAYDPKTGKVA